MKRVIMLKGLPASGKSTWARNLVASEPGRYKRISKDDLRAMLDNSRWSKSNEQFILKTRDALILLALQEGYHVLIDDTNLHPKHEQAIRELVKGLAQVEIQDFTHVPLEECIARDQQRPNYVGEQVIRKMFADFLQPKPVSPPYDPVLPGAILCDLDGTLALIDGRNPYDASRCEQDLLNVPVADVVKKYHASGYTILLVSGRKEQHRTQTERWLAHHTIPYHTLLMRQSDDNRKDWVVKQEIYQQQIQGHYNVLFVLDDRSQVVSAWRANGLTVFQVAEGNY